MNKIIARPNVDAIPIVMASLDDFLSEKNHDIDLIKIDAEGYELHILQGATKTLANTQCIYIEASYNNCHKYGYSFAEIIDFLRAHSFDIFYLKNGCQMIKITGHDLSLTENNVIAVKSVAQFLERTNYLLTNEND